MKHVIRPFRDPNSSPWMPTLLVMYPDLSSPLRICVIRSTTTMVQLQWDATQQFYPLDQVVKNA